MCVVANNFANLRNSVLGLFNNDMKLLIICLSGLTSITCLSLMHFMIKKNHYKRFPVGHLRPIGSYLRISRQGDQSNDNGNVTSSSMIVPSDWTLKPAESQFTQVARIPLSAAGIPSKLSLYCTYAY